MRTTIRFLLAMMILYPAGAAAASLDEGPAAAYNRGVRQYRDKDFESAASSFEQVKGMTSDPKLLSRGAYNAGNALFRQGKLQESVEKYKQALRLNPDDLDAKHNLEFARRLLAAQPAASQQKKQEGSGDESQNKQQGGGEGRDKRQGEDASRPEDKKGNQDRREAGAKPKEGMSKEDAERLLQAVEGQERDARRKQQMWEPEKRQVEQDW